MKKKESHDYLKLIGQKKYFRANQILKKLYYKNSNNLNYTLAFEHTKMALCDWNNINNRKRQLKKKIKNFIKKKKEKLNFPLCYFPINVTQELYERIENLKKVDNKCFFNKKSFNKKKTINIGYLSLDFLSHSNGLPLYPVIKTHNKSKMRVYAYTLRSQKIPKKTFFKVRVIDKLSISEIADIINRDKLDVLIETTRNLLFSKSKVLNYKPASFNLSAWGYGEFCNLKNFDYLIVDKFLKKKLKMKKIKVPFFTIKNYNLIKPALVNTSKKNLRKKYNLPKDSILIGNFNAIYKLKPNLLDAWVNILKKINNSFFLIICENKLTKKNLIQEITKRRINSKRFLFLKRVSFKKHLDRLMDMDLALDNPLMGGGSTLTNSLCVGLPVITFKGFYLGSFSGENILVNNQLNNFVAENLNEYQNKAVSILKNKKDLIRAKKKFTIISNKLPEIWKKSSISLNKNLIGLGK